MLQPVLALRAFWKIWTVYFFNLPNFFSVRGKPRITETTDTESADTGVRQYQHCMLEDGQGPKDDYFSKLDRNVKTGVKSVCKIMRQIYIVVQTEIWNVFKECG